MGTTPAKPQRLSVRASHNTEVLSTKSFQARDDDGGRGNWGTLQIATPAIVGGVLILVFAVYIIWQRRPLQRDRSYDYHQVRSDWVTRIERMFVPRRARQRVLRSSAPVTLDDSIRSSGFTFDFRRTRALRSDSSDSQTPLTASSHAFDYPPVKNLPGSPSAPASKRLTFRWWWLFGSRPKEIKSQEPGSRWRVDGPDRSSTGHGHSNHGHHVAALVPVREVREDVEESVVRTGENFISVASTPMVQHFSEQAQATRGMSPVPKFSGSSGARTPLPIAASTLRSNPGTPTSWSNGDLPPSYDISQSCARHQSAEDIIRFTPPKPYMIIPTPVSTPGYPSSRVFHGHEFSSNSILAAQPPMVTTSIY